MLSARLLYPVVQRLLQAMDALPHGNAQAPLAQLVSALLTAQSLRPAALMRMLPSSPTVPAAQRYRRLRRAWLRSWLTSAWLTPRLVRAALALTQPSGPAVLALDTVRCGRWEIFTLGLVWSGRCLPLGWSVLAYPWPKGRFTPTVCQLVRTVADAWPPGQPPPHLLADRGFPSRALLRTLQDAGWGFTIRLGARHSVWVDGALRRVGSLWPAAAGCWQQQAASFGRGRDTVSGWVVVGRGLPVLAWHQRDDGSARARQQQWAERRTYLERKHRRRGPTQAVTTDRWVALLTSEPRWRQALTFYKRRWSIEGTYRDLQGGWGGRQGWDLERVVGPDADVGAVEARVGLAALGLVCQLWLGDRAQRVSRAEAVGQLCRQWTTSDRLSPWARGYLLLADREGSADTWVLDCVAEAAQIIADAPPLAHPALGACRTLRSRPERRAA